MFEPLLALFGCFLVVVAAACLVVPFIALHRTRRIDEILSRLRSLEDRFELLCDEIRRRPRVVEKVEDRVDEARQPPQGQTTEEPDFVLADAAPSETEPPQSHAKIAKRTYAERERARRRSAEVESLNLESWIGGRALGWVAVILLLLASAFFFRELFERNLIGPVGRVSIGIFFGCLACVAGYRQHLKGWPVTCQMLTSGGVVLLYLSAFASFGYYKLLSTDEAGIFLVLVIAEALALAVAYEAPAIAVLAIIGGLLNPILLRTDQDRYVSLFTYLTVLNAGVVGLTLVRRWRAIAILTIVGTNLLFWLWYEQNYHPNKLTAAILFHLAWTGLWLCHQLLGPLKRFASLDPEDALRLFVQAFFLSVAGYKLLDPRIPQWMGTLALAVAIVHVAFTWLVVRLRPADALHAACEWTLATSFVAAAIFLQADANWIAVLWAVQGLALWGFSLKIQSTKMRGLSLALFAMALVRFWFTTTTRGWPHPHPFVPIVNVFAMTGLTIAACFLVAAILGRRDRPDPDSPDFALTRLVGLAGLFVVWLVLSFDAFDYFNVQRNVSDPAVQAQLQRVGVERNREDYDAFLARRDVRLQRSAQVSLSIVWGLFAIVLTTLGLRLPSRPLRWSALALFGLTLAKVMTLDMGNLPGLYRVAALLGLSMMMGAAAWAYQKVKLSLLVETEDGHESAI